MPKRKSSLSEIEELKIKLKKLERNQLRGRRRIIRVFSSSSESSVDSSGRRSPIQGVQSGDESPVRSVAAHDYAIPSTSSRTDEFQQSNPGSAVVQPTAATSEVTEPIKKNPEADIIGEAEISSDILEILGDDPSSDKKYGKDIQKDLATRFEHISTNGLSRAQRKEFREKYLIPANCTLIDVPKINPELKAAVSDLAANRLGGMEQKQKQLASAISCIGEAITLMMSNNNTDPKLLQLMMDAGRMICDTQYSETLTRRFYVLSTLKKEMKDVLLQTKIDTFLFGSNLSETLKNAKSISKSGVELKQPNRQTSWKPNFNKKQDNLNLRAPPSSYRSTGSTRGRLPAPKNQHVSSSRNSRQNNRRSYR